MRTDQGFSEHCAALELGPAETHVFKLPNRMSCRRVGALLRAAWPWQALELVRTVPGTCAGIEPAWVHAEIEQVAPLVGDALPVVAGYSSASRGVRWELEWQAASIDQDAIEARLDSLGYSLSEHTGSRLWKRQRTDTNVFSLDRGGPRHGRLVVRGRMR